MRTMPNTKKAKRRKKVVAFEVKPYERNIYVCRPGLTEDEIAEVYKSLKLKPEQDFRRDGTEEAITYFLDDGGAFLYFKKARLGTIAHESCHVIFALLKSCGIPIKGSNDETFAYALEAVFTNIREAIKTMR